MSADIKSCGSCEHWRESIEGPTRSPGMCAVDVPNLPSCFSRTWTAFYDGSACPCWQERSPAADAPDAKDAGRG